MKQRGKNKLTYEEYVEWRKTHKSNGDGVDNSKYSKVSTIREETAIEETLRIARILKANGVNLSKVQMRKKINGKYNYILLEEIKQEGIDMQKIIRENKLDGKFKFGMRVNNLRSAYNGVGSYKITEEQKKEAKELGLLSRKEETAIEETAIEETLRIARILKANKVDLSKIQLAKTVNGKMECILLEEIEQDGIDMKKIIEKNKLDGKFKFGMRVTKLKSTCNGRRIYKITEEQKKEAKELGLLSRKEETAIEETLRIARILKANKVDLSKIQLAKTVNGKQKYILLEEIEQDGIDMQKIIEENGLDRKFKYGKSASYLRKSYSGVVDCKITEEQKREAEELGLISKSLIDKEKQKQQAERENQEARELYSQYEELLDLISKYR